MSSLLTPLSPVGATHMCMGIGPSRKEYGQPMGQTPEENGLTPTAPDSHLLLLVLSQEWGLVSTPSIHARRLTGFILYRQLHGTVNLR